MAEMHEYHGYYYFMGVALEVSSPTGVLKGAMPGVPEGYEIVLEPAGGDSFVSRGGPIDGSEVTFARDDRGDVVALRVGTYDLAKIDPEAAESLPVTERLLAPTYELTDEKRGEFDALLRTATQAADGGWIDYDLPYARHEFVQHVTERDQVIFHGSNRTEIASFEPVRESVEYRDETGRGNVQGVYGTHDGLWAMFFAVADRRKLVGSIRNGVMYFRSESGEQLAVYNFSVNQEQLSEAPYADGALYLLPRGSFRRTMLTEATFSNEWVSEHPVKPLAKLRVAPADFPFLDRIGGHDDSEVIRLGQITKEIRAAAVSATLDGDRLEIAIPSGADVLDRMDDYLALLRVYMPAVRYELAENAAEVLLVASGLPPAVRQTFQESYADLLGGAAGQGPITD